jgi:poly(3-hydroxybutyrate) depolymerase
LLHYSQVFLTHKKTNLASATSQVCLYRAPSQLGRLSTKGHVYIPAACRTEQCRLHVSLHGCGIPFALTGALASSLSFNKIAETNKIVVLWPQRALELLVPHATWDERQGCWDGYGQTGKDYDTRRGAQMVAIRRMIEHISGVNMSVQE